MQWIGLVILVSLLQACATAPTGPSVMVLPGSGVSFEQFQTDDATCRQWAGHPAGSPSPQRQYDIAYQQCMYIKGHAIPGAPPAHRASSPTDPSSAPR